MKRVEMLRKRAYNRATIVPALQEAGEGKLADKIEYCGEWSRIARCTGCGAQYFAGVDRCKTRFCAICSRLRADAWLAKLIPLLQSYIERGYYVFMLNLTIRDMPDLQEALGVLREAWRQMTHEDKASRTTWHRLNCGGVRSVEVKLGKGSGQWHPHIHALTLYKPPAGVLRVRQFEEYKTIWERAVNAAAGTTDKSGSVYVHGIKDKTGDGGLVSGVVETFKYIAKCEWSHMPAAAIGELVRETKGKHFISAWGALYGLGKQVEELMNTTPAEEIRGRACKACGCTDFELSAMLSDELGEEVGEF